jgi:hypothetical protein
MFEISKIFADAVYDGEIYTYYIFVSNPEGERYGFILPYGKVQELGLKVGITPKAITLTGMIFDPELTKNINRENEGSYFIEDYKIVGGKLCYSSDNLTLKDVELYPEEFVHEGNLQKLPIRFSKFSFSLREIKL